MSNSNSRNKEVETVHHLTSRIAHRVYFLKECERNDFLEIVRRAADFAGIKLLGWCVMSNHFHLLVHLPERVEVCESEVLRRYGVLKGRAAAEEIEKSFVTWRKDEVNGEARVTAWLESQRRRMYDVGIFMKIVKQWFTEEYNKRNGHCGTLWEAVYHDRVVPFEIKAMSECLGYIHLNPIRAAVTDRFDGYAWSSYAAFCRGDEVAIEGMRFIYGEECSAEEMSQMHEELLECLLEKEKLRRAAEIVRRRAAGYEMPADPLTTEAYLRQAAMRLEEIRLESMRLREERMLPLSRVKKRDHREREVIAALTLNPSADVKDLSNYLAIPVRTAYDLLQKMESKGLVMHTDRGGFWTMLQNRSDLFCRFGDAGKIACRPQN